MCIRATWESTEARLSLAQGTCWHIIFTRALMTAGPIKITRPCSQPCAELGHFSRHPSSDTGATAQAVSLGGCGCVLDALHGSHALPWSTVSDLDLWGTVQWAFFEAHCDGPHCSRHKRRTSG